MLTIPLQKLAYIIEKAREFDAEVPVDPDEASGSNPADDDERQILEDTPDNPTPQELRDAIDGLNLDEREELLALMWLGRGRLRRQELVRGAARGAADGECDRDRLSSRHAAARRLSRRGRLCARPVARGFRTRLEGPIPFSSSRRRPGPISAIGAGLRRCDKTFGIWWPLTDKSCEWI
jgi:hypothetical protein